MAEVTLVGLWAQPVADPSSVLTLRARSWDERPSRQAEGFALANGDTAVVVGAANQDEPAVELVQVTRVQVDQLEAWLGTLLQFRDRTGRQLFGVLQQVRIPDAAWGASDTTLQAVTLNLLEASYSVAV